LIIAYVLYRQYLFSIKIEAVFILIRRYFNALYIKLMVGQI